MISLIAEDKVLLDEEDKASSLSDHEIDVEDIDEPDRDGSSFSPARRHSVSISPVKEEHTDDDEDLVDGEEQHLSKKNRNSSKKGSGGKSGKKSSNSGGSGSSGSGSTNPQVKPRCNCDHLRLVDCHLETKELWDKFNELGTEMIITKTGRYVSCVIFLFALRSRRSGTIIHHHSPLIIVNVKVELRESPFYDYVWHSTCALAYIHIYTTHYVIVII